MAKLFISYSRQDRNIAEALAGRLSAAGYDVWWDAELVGGQQFADAIQQALTAADAAIILWSENAVASDWVRAEAEVARQSKKAIPVIIDGLAVDALPIVFRNLHVIDMRKWRGDASARGYTQLLAAIEQRTGTASKPAEPTAPPKPNRNWTAIAAAGVATLIVVVAAIFGTNFYLSQQPAPGPTDLSSLEVSSSSVETSSSSLETLPSNPDKPTVPILANCDPAGVVTVPDYGLALCADPAIWDAVVDNSNEPTFRATDTDGTIYLVVRRRPLSFATTIDALADNIDTAIEDQIGMDHHTERLGYTDITLGGKPWKRLDLRWMDSELEDYLYMSPAGGLEVYFTSDPAHSSDRSRLAAPVIQSIRIGN